MQQAAAAGQLGLFFSPKKGPRKSREIWQATDNPHLQLSQKRREEGVVPAEILCRCLGSWSRRQSASLLGFNKSLTPTDLTILSKPLSQFRFVLTPRGKKSAQDFSYYLKPHLAISGIPTDIATSNQGTDHAMNTIHKYMQ